MEKVGLKIVEMLHTITQSGYQVQFCGDFENMIRLEITDEYEPEVYYHWHLGSCTGNNKLLETAIIDCLDEFITGVINVQTNQ